VKIYFNTKAFKILTEKYKLDITDDLVKAELAVLGAKKIDFRVCKNLKAVYRFGVGHENIPPEILEKGRPPVYFPSEKTKRILFESSTNFTVYLIFHMHYSRNIGNVDNWKKETRDFIGNKTLLIIGTGNIGGRVAKKMSPFIKVCTYDIKDNQPEELKPLIEKADYISLHIPVLEDTIGFIDTEKISWMKDDAVLINTARGILVNENSLNEKITKTNFRAAFDVFWKEPYSGKLKKLGKEKFFMTPHTSSQTLEYVREGFNDILRIIKEYKDKR